MRKTYRQRVRSARLRDIADNLLRPRIRIVEALRGIDLIVRRGEIVAYAGPNGAGKSTTIKLLSGLLAPDSGSVRALGMDPVDERVRYVGRIGVVYSVSAPSCGGITRLRLASSGSASSGTFQPSDLSAC